MKPTFLDLRVAAAMLLATIGAFGAEPGLQQQIPSSEYAALVDLYNSTQGPKWRSNYGWNDPSAPFWSGVTVSGFVYDAGAGRILSVGTVIKLELIAAGLSGPIPESLGKLSNL